MDVYVVTRQLFSVSNGMVYQISDNAPVVSCHSKFEDACAIARDLCRPFGYIVKVIMGGSDACSVVAYDEDGNAEVAYNVCRQYLY